MGKPSSGELLQGTLPLIVLRILLPGPSHGFAIARRIQVISKDVLRAEEGSLYPALHKMELEGWIDAEWRVTENNRKAKYYRLTAAGRKQLKLETERWNSLAGAIGVNTVVFSLIQEIFFSTPTARSAHELVTIQLGGSSHASLANLRDLDASGIVEKVAGFDVETTVNWRNGDTVRQTPVMFVSENYFELLETRPALGRGFRSDEARAELKPHVVLITHRLWTHAFAQDPGILGKTLVLNGR